MLKINGHWPNWKMHFQGIPIENQLFEYQLSTNLQSHPYARVSLQLFLYFQVSSLEEKSLGRRIEIRCFAFAKYLTRMVLHRDVPQDDVKAAIDKLTYVIQELKSKWITDLGRNVNYCSSWINQHYIVASHLRRGSVDTMAWGLCNGNGYWGSLTRN